MGREERASVEVNVPCQEHWKLQGDAASFCSSVQLGEAQPCPRTGQLSLQPAHHTALLLTLLHSLLTAVFHMNSAMGAGLLYSPRIVMLAQG